MRKQTKIVIATALLALGASFTSMAAAKNGTWVLEDDGWYCYDKNGDAWEDEFCLSYGKEYYMGSDGLLVTNSWVEADGDYYYVGSKGAKTINDWRFVTPEDDEDAEEEWYYFDSAGKMVTGKIVVDNKTYYFDEDGKMLTGWVSYANKKAEVADGNDATASLVYCDETGARMANEWVNTFVPGTAEEDQADAVLFWYYIKAKGAVQTGRNLDIDGRTYFFGEDGKMLSGWVAAIYADNDGKFDEYKKLGYQYSAEVISAYTNGVYYCGSADQGWAKTDRWIKTWAPAAYYDADADVSQNWYYLAKSGKVYVPAATSASDADKMTFADGSKVLGTNAFVCTGSDAVEVTLKKIDKKTYAFDANGAMISGFVQVDAAQEMAEGMYYFGGADDGAMKTGSIVIEDEEGINYDFFFGKKNTTTGYKLGVGVTGAASGELYNNGLIVTADGDEDYKEVQVAGKYFIVDEDGDIRTSKKQYKDEDGNVYLNTVNTTFETAEGNLKGSYGTSAE